MIVGVDEAGRGPVIGPLVVAGVAVESDVPLRHLNVRDSKKLSPERREALAPEIEKVSTYELVVIPAERIDVMRSEMSLNDFEAKLFAEVIDKLRPETAYVDAADVDEIEFKRCVRKELAFDVEIVSQHNADELFPVVSAASILAKVCRDREMRLIEDEIGLHIGSGYASDTDTIAFLETWIRQHGSLPPHTRASWDTARRLLAGSRNHKLDEFGGGIP
ncbi:MAG: ribonuclease HII [Methanobacteriota archaeon]|nr:MAG: ribonuclease HII [Euryarchaeota archaeon]TLZ66100.1 MAG: ribonuclease HII [Euryarchaeota archaeon]